MFFALCDRGCFLRFSEVCTFSVAVFPKILAIVASIVQPLASGKAFTCSMLWADLAKVAMQKALKKSKKDAKAASFCKPSQTKINACMWLCV